MPTRQDDVAAESGDARLRVWSVVVCEVLLSLGLGFYQLGHKSLWNDEGFTAMASSRGPAGALSVARHFESNMFLHNLLLGLWRAALGSGEAALRSLSVVAAAAAVVAVFLVASRLFGTTTGLIAGFLLAVAPFAVRYAQEARSYSLLLLLVTLGAYFFVVGIEKHDSRWFALYAVTAAASCYAHLFGLLVILAQASSLFFLGRRNLPIRQLVTTAAVLVVLLLPLGYFVTVAPQAAGSGGRPTVSSAASVLANVAGGKLLLVLLGGLCLVPVVMAWRAWQLHGPSFETWRIAFVLTWLVVPYVVALGAALAVEPNWVDRYLIVILPALVVTAALAVRQIGDRRVVVALLVVAAVLAGFKIQNWYQAPAHEDWRSAVAFVTRSSTPEDGIVFCIPSVRAPFEYYALQHPASQRPQPLSPSHAWSNGLHVNGVAAEETSAWQSAPDRIWVVSRYASASPSGACDLSTSMEGRTRSTSQDIGNVLVERYDRG